MRKLLLVCAVLIATVSVLYFAFGLRLEMRGDGIVPLFRFGSEEDRYERLEDHRGNQPRHIAAPPAELGRELPAGAETWTKFRGPRMDGDYREQPVLTDWPPDGPALLWRQPIGGGYASFVVADGRAFTIEQRRDEETAVAYDVPSGTELWTCLDARTGERMWKGGRYGHGQLVLASGHLIHPRLRQGGAATSPPGGKGISRFQTACFLPTTLAGGGTRMIHVTTTGRRNGLVQVFLPFNTGSCADHLVGVDIRQQRRRWNRNWKRGQHRARRLHYHDRAMGVPPGSQRCCPG